MEMPWEEVARCAFISAPQRAVLDALPGARGSAAAVPETRVDFAAGSAPPQGGSTYMQEQELPTFGNGPAPASQPLKSGSHAVSPRQTEPPAQPDGSRGAPAGHARAAGVAPQRHTLSARPGRLAAEEPRDAHVHAALEPSTQAPDAEGASPPAKAPAETARFSAKALFAAIGSKRRALHAERKA